MTEAVVVDEDDKNANVLNLLEKARENIRDVSFLSLRLRQKALLSDTVRQTRASIALEESTDFAPGTKSPEQQQDGQDDSLQHLSLPQSSTNLQSQPTPIVVPESSPAIYSGPPSPRTTLSPRSPRLEKPQQRKSDNYLSPPIANCAFSTMIPSPALPPPPAPQQICLCQQPARIPRPRNAFILFRQHNHAPVAAANPGKPNPEISKIIGQMWKSSDDDVKAIWQNHADEEKRQHLARYPQYRYQPRRNGKKAAATLIPSSNSSENTLCPHCGGRTGNIVNFASPAGKRPASRRKTTTSNTDIYIRKGVGRGDPHVQNFVETGLEGLSHSEEDIISASDDPSPSKRRKLNPSSNFSTVQSSPPSDLDASAEDTLSRVTATIIDTEVNITGDPNEVPEDPSQPVLSGFMQAIKAIPTIDKIRWINKNCHPTTIISSQLSSTTRLPVVAVEGEEPDVSSLCLALAEEIKRTESVHHVEVPIYTSRTRASSSDSMKRDGDLDAKEVANYLNHVAMWHLKCAEIRKIVEKIDKEGAQQSGSLVLINRYILSRVEDAIALRLHEDGFPPLEHWRWCAALWRGCIGADLTIYTETLPEGSIVGDDAVESKDKGRAVFVRKTAGDRGWDDKIVRRLGFEVGEVIRSLQGTTV